MSDSKKIPRPRCGWCGAEIRSKLRLASKWRGKWYCGGVPAGAGCGPNQGQRGRTRPTHTASEAKRT